ncbi:hypothetical protein SS50377_28534 [Spironucleus salmonicida]|uniref:Uncharacterized protein n=1 Tax=Spironucleus salmonicida TaxID=348837 RepID=V6LLP8_9EUKA|nr:hypothetical protein SS50377_28534 [Spironucleus salmonicida]|eukprot:EST41634.1 Hypothetical protein SS50377_18990 [Spironucleus salmonicida]
MESRIKSSLSRLSQRYVSEDPCSTILTPLQHIPTPPTSASRTFSSRNALLAIDKRSKAGIDYFTHVLRTEQK